MKKIASFTIDHTILPKGLYTSRVDGDCVTYDIRTRLPNREPVMETGAIHTIEHLFATFARNSAFSDSVVYFGPMGCRTGFYFIVRDAVTPQQAIDLVRDALAFCAAFEGDVPGVSARECGNWRDHDLAGAKKEAAAMCAVLKNWTPADLAYPTK
ncbi:MAG: S-ribosylhomocysteine lyase [Clostridia bacterium]|nr:S-ribosylhomocysteine lyase [Clostridia bacterium]MBQ6092778.1 S-ribosylhomocysteine lyase [Clostridia bacterium]MBR3095330.1 S-ribosylhomocysteine lyase [Clostridia bacterium]